MRNSPPSSLTHTKHMKALATLFIIAAISWLAIVTFCGPELYRVINGPEPVKSKAVRSHR